jgi:hypothetical protein
MQKDAPLVPRVVERAFEFLHIAHEAEAALGIGVLELIASWNNGRRELGLRPGCQVEQGFRGLGGKVTGNHKLRDAHVSRFIHDG